MSRRPLVVAVDCDTCERTIIIHARGREISIQWLEAHLIKHGWSFSANGRDFCENCNEDSTTSQSVQDAPE